MLWYVLTYFGHLQSLPPLFLRYPIGEIYSQLCKDSLISIWQRTSCFLSRIRSPVCWLYLGSTSPFRYLSLPGHVGFLSVRNLHLDSPLVENNFLLGIVDVLLLFNTVRVLGPAFDARSSMSTRKDLESFAPRELTQYFGQEERRSTLEEQIRQYRFPKYDSEGE